MHEDKYTNIAVLLIGLTATVWLALLIAPYTEAGLSGILSDGGRLFSGGAGIVWTGQSLKTILLFILIYAFGIGVYLSMKKNTRPGEEHGSAKWGNADAVCRKYREEGFGKNKILSRNVFLGLDERKHGRNLNILVVGGSGSGKTRAFAKPNVMQANTSMVILDPKGEILRDTGHLLKKEGYDIRILDLIHMEKSYCYNPFVYLTSDNDVQRLVTNLFKATMTKGGQSQDPFWDNAASMLLLALIFYLKYEAPPEEQNFEMVMELLRAGDVREDQDSYVSILDELFFRLEMKNPEHIALKYYHDYHTGSAKTLKSIQITLASRLDKFNLASLAALTRADEMGLESLGTKKVALFAIIPDSDTSFNFLVSILYTQLFQTLFYIADHRYGGSLPQHVHFIMDEFANVSLPEDFDKILSVMRSRNVSVSIILQNLAQLKALFEKQWESITGNCDSFLYLGGNEQSTHKYVSELIGKETIDSQSHGKSMGHHGTYSTNTQNIGRELMTPDEVRMLDNRYCILFIRGEKPLFDQKYSITGHPNAKFTPDGMKGAEVYRQDETPGITAVITLYDNDGGAVAPPFIAHYQSYELLADEEAENAQRR